MIDIDSSLTWTKNVLFLNKFIITFHFINGIHLCFLPLSNLLQNGFLGDADIDRLKLADSYINGTQVQVNV